MRGDYVSLCYEISRIPVSQITNLPPEAYTSTERSLYVRVKKGSDGYWHPVSATFDAPLHDRARPGRSRRQGDRRRGLGHFGPGTSVDPDYGIDRFYLPEGEGMAIQDDMRVRPFGVRIALAADGTPQIKALLDGDKVLYEEPLY